MWTNLALAVALSTTLGQAGQLTISNVRTPYGFFGPERPDNKLLPGDHYLIVFDVDGVTVEPKDAKVEFSLAMDVSDSNGKVVYTQPPTSQEANLTLGGAKVQASTRVTTGFEQAPGKYTVKVTVTDKKTKASQKLTRDIELLPKDFGIVQIFSTADPNAQYHCPLSGVTGQYLTINFALVGFERSKANKQPDVSVEMRVLDKNGKPTLDKPFVGNVNNNVGANILGLPMQFHLALNRPGKFSIELKAMDNVINKTAKKVTLPLTVIEQKGSNPE